MSVSTEKKQQSEVASLMELINSNAAVGCGSGCCRGGFPGAIPVGKLVNDIAEIYKADHGNKDAEEALLALLEKESDNIRFIAYCGLLAFGQENPKVISKIEIFRGKPENAELILQAKERFGV